MKRYGLQWNGPREFVCTEMQDGLWVTYQDALAAIEQAREETRNEVEEEMKHLREIEFRMKGLEK